MVAKRNEWWRHKENALLLLAVLVVIPEFINAEILGRHFHAEFLVFAGACIGAWATQLGDKK